MPTKSVLASAALLLLCTMPLPVLAETAPTPPVQTAPPTVTAVEKSVDPLKASPSLRVGYADIMKIAEKSTQGKAAKARFEVRSEKLKAEIDGKQKLLEKQKKTLEAKLPTYEPKQRVAKIKEYEKKVEEFRKLLQKADKELKPMQEKLLKEIYARIEKAATEYGAANGFSLILVKNDVLYLGKNVDVQDVTDELTKHLHE